MGIVRDHMAAARRGITATTFLESLDGDSLREELSSEQRATLEAAAVRNRQARQAVAPVQESAESWLRRHAVPAPSACFRPVPLQEAADSSGKLTEFRARHFVTHDYPTARRLAVLQNPTPGHGTPRPDFGRRVTCLSPSPHRQPLTPTPVVSPGPPWLATGWGLSSHTTAKDNKMHPLRDSEYDFAGPTTREHCESANRELSALEAEQPETQRLAGQLASLDPMTVDPEAAEQLARTVARRRHANVKAAVGPLASPVAVAASLGARPAASRARGSDGLGAAAGGNRGRIESGGVRPPVGQRQPRGTPAGGGTGCRLRPRDCGGQSLCRAAAMADGSFRNGNGGTGGNRPVDGNAAGQCPGSGGGRLIPVWWPVGGWSPVQPPTAGFSR